MLARRAAIHPAAWDKGSAFCRVLEKRGVHFCLSELVKSGTLAQSRSFVFEFAEVFRALARGLDCVGSLKSRRVPLFFVY